MKRFFPHHWRLIFAAMLVWVAPMVRAYDDRIALVIGNDAYPTEPLKNAVNDARSVAKTLTDLGFKVVVKTNADITTMRGAAVEFAKLLDGASAAVFYYAGHGIQYRDKNYLVPVDAKLTSEPEIVYNALEVGQLLESMDDAKVKFKFIILDACRNNPFRNVFQSTGLAKISKVPPGTIISYAAAAGAVAMDGDGENGLYTQSLLKEIRDPNHQAAQMFQRVASNVAQESNNKQLPELYSTPLPRGAFFFSERGAQTAVNPQSNSVSGDTNALLDREFWSSVKESRRADDYEAYLAQFPRGTFSALARSRISSIKQERIQQQTAATPLSATPTNAPSILVAENQTEPPRPSTQTNQLAQVTQTSQVAQVDKPPVVATAAISANTTPSKETQSVPQSALPQTAPSPSPVKPSTVERTTQLASAEPPSSAPTARTNAADAPLKLASASPSGHSESRGIEAKSPVGGNISGGSLAAPATSVPSNAAPGANQVASLSPEQKTSLPPVPVFPKFLTGTLEFSGGARYVGGYKEDKDKNQILHGKGEYVAESFRYLGEFKDGKKDGRGAYTWANGDKYEGDFADDQPSGRGKWDFASGDKYEGEISRSVMVGKGVFVAKNGDRFEGLFKDNAPNGKGVYTFVSGDKFEGDMIGGKMSGRGVYTTKNGDRLEAPFVDGAAQGKGAYYFANGDRYEGEIKGGALTGKGAYFYSNGLRSEGTYVNGALKGEGSFFFNDGSWFEGTFDDGLKRAKGTSILKDGTKRPAEIVDGAVKITGG